MSTRYTDKQYGEALVKKFREGGFDDNDFDVDDKPAVSNGEDAGAYVAIWHWMSDEEMAELGFEPREEANDDRP
jgi:hypothetical protein